jgi:dipeptidyl aminopeptidase/acylaminoacyl peptidase
MKQIILFLQLLVLSMAALAQKKVLDHTVYDGWQSIGERKISADGEWVAYTIDIQEGDGLLVVQRSDSSFKQTFSRGYNLAFTNDNLFLVFKVKPAYLDTRNAKIKKKKPEDQPKDSLVILDLTTKTTQSFADVASYKMPKNAVGYLSFLKIKKSMDSVLKPAPKDSIKQKIDTLKQQVPILIEHQPEKKQKRKLTAKGEQDQESSDDTEMNEDAEGDDNASQTVQEGSNLVLYNFSNKTQSIFPFTNEYYWSENGKILLMESSASKNNKNRKPLVSIWRTVENRLDTILLGGNDFKGFAIDKNGYQISFLAERDSAFKSPQKFYKLWYWKNGDQEASVIADRFTIGMKVNWTINDNYVPNFSKSGNRLFIGTAPVKSIKDTSLVEMDLVKLDVWHYNDDYLQPYQLRNLQQEERKSYLSMYDLQTKSFIQLGDLDLPQVLISNEGDGSFFLGMSDVGKRVSMQWEGGTKKDIYTVNPTTGVRTLITKDLNGMAQISPEGKYIFWYDMSKKNYFTYNGNQIVNATKSIQTKLYDEDYDMPSDPSPYGLMRWEKNDAAFYVYDRFDIWRVDPFGKVLPKMVTGGWGRKTNTSFRYISLDPEERAIESAQHIVLRAFNEKNKYAGYAFLQLGVDKQPKILQMGAYALGNPIKADNANAYVFTKESFDQSPNLHFSKTLVDATKLSNINPQQQEYNWMTAELFTWKAYNGKLATGIVYKPENFDPKKKYPMIAYFYETLSDGLYNYLPPSPTPSRLNIPFFVSRGYIVLAPDIYYEKGYPGKGGFDYVVSGARALARKGWVDSTKMGIQGQSWGGYQVAHIITRTNLFAAAWAGAPVANMTSAYGGIRWESGMNRQFQYEKSQSRIGASLWEKTSLYIENSPLFYLKKVTTPLVIMANDNDGAVPWYQGIEMFTAMRRLDKKVWMLNYNGEAHNLVERKNRKDIQIREQQFFDWLLKGEKPAIWLKYGVPAIEKGKSWGLETSLD